MALAGQKVEGLRAAFFVSSAITCIAPFGGWYGLWAWYIYDAYTNPRDANNENKPYEETLFYIDWYIFAKLFIFIAATCINTFITSEMIKPIYDWWQVLAVLEDTIPYDRPAEEDVEAGDTAASDEEGNEGSSGSEEAFTF